MTTKRQSGAESLGRVSLRYQRAIELWDPDEDRAACENLWADVAALLKKADTPATKEGKR